MNIKHSYLPMGNDNNPKYFGPYLRANKHDKWHWLRSCPRYPNISSPEIRFSTAAPDSQELCNVCSDMELQGEKKQAL